MTDRCDTGFKLTSVTPTQYALSALACDERTRLLIDKTFRLSGSHVSVGRRESMSMLRPATLKLTDGVLNLCIVIETYACTYFSILAKICAQGIHDGMFRELTTTTFHGWTAGLGRISRTSWTVEDFGFDPAGNLEEEFLVVDLPLYNLRCAVMPSNEFFNIVRSRLDFSGPIGLSYRNLPAIPMRLVLGVRNVSLPLLKRMRAGDALLHFCSIITEAGRTKFLAKLICGAMGRWTAEVDASLDDGFVEIIGNLKLMDSNHASMRPVRSSAELVDGFSQLSIPVHIEVDTVPISFQDLQAIRPGFILQTGLKCAHLEVRLVTQGKVIGRGQLVSIAQDVGVRITWMANEHDERE